MQIYKQIAKNPEKVQDVCMVFTQRAGVESVHRICFVNTSVERASAKSLVQLVLFVNITGRNLYVQCVLGADCVSTKNPEIHALNVASICGFASVTQIPLRIC